MLCLAGVCGAFYLCFGGDRNKARAPPRPHNPHTCVHCRSGHSCNIHGRPHASPYSPYAESQCGGYAKGPGAPPPGPHMGPQGYAGGYPPSHPMPPPTNTMPQGYMTQQPTNTMPQGYMTQQPPQGHYPPGPPAQGYPAPQGPGPYAMPPPGYPGRV